MKLARLLVLLSAIALFLGGIAHTFGYTRISTILAGSTLSPKIADALRCVWLVFTAEAVLLAPALVWISRRPGTRSLLLYLALIPVVDAVLMYHFVGFFIGFYIVSASALLLLAGAWQLPRNQGV